MAARKKTTEISMSKMVMMILGGVLKSENGPIREQASDRKPIIAKMTWN